MEKYSFVNICRHYGKKQVLAGATGQFPAGSFVGILGLNGSGKTTLLNILGNLDRRFTGVITLRGKKVAYMRTRMPYPEWWKVSDVLGFCGRFYDFDAERAERMLQNTDVRRNARLFSLSEGMKRQLNFIAAYCVRSEVLLLDEPLTNLDVNYRGVIVDALIERAMEERVIAVATHEIKEFENLFTHVTVLQGGRLSELAGAEEIRASGMGIEEYYRGCLR